MKINELKPGMRAVNTGALTVQSVSPPREVTTRRGEQSRIATAIVQDETGHVALTLWNETIDQVKAGGTVTVENGYIDSFRGETQLNVGRFGKLTTGA